MLILKSIKGGIKAGTLIYKVKNGGTDASEEVDNFDVFDDDDDDDDDDDEGLMV